MNVHVLQHVPFEGLGRMADWLAARQTRVSWTRFFEPTKLPSPAGLDLIIAMGGPMSVNDEAALPWLKAEKQFLREAIGHGVAVVGVCLGAQLIASALGAQIRPNAQKEIGWFPVEAVAGSAASFRFPAVFTAFHWHGETFELPPGAVHLARSAACANQAFQVGVNVIGLQFHLETTPESADAIISGCRDELQAGPFVQTEAVLRAVPAATYAGVNRLMEEILAYVTRAET